MKKLRILALMDRMLVPPEDARKKDSEDADWKTEYDVVTTLRKAGHEVHPLGVGDELRVVRTAVEELKPHIAFNLLEDFHDIPTFDQNVVSYLELLRLPYTGCNPRGLTLARDKAIAKMLLSYHRIPVPEFAVFPRGRQVRRPKRLAFPLIVKSLIMEASTGISQNSVVDSDEKLVERVRFVHEQLGTDAIVERYIDGRELYVGVCGNERLLVFPVWEMIFTNLPAEKWRIATDRVKWSADYRKKWGIKTAEAKGLPEGAAAKIPHLCKRVYRALGLSGYARIDLRMDESGRAHVLEVNPNPQIAYGEDFAESADRAGITYPDLLQRILSYGLKWRPELVQGTGAASR